MSNLTVGRIEQLTHTTPGPWAADRNDVRVAVRGGLFIARCYAIPCEDEPERYNGERAANARLIAAAPELLAALRLFLERYVSLVNCGDCGNWDPETDEEVIQARAAIAKAESR